MAKEKVTFKQWCINNNRQDLLDRWDYEKTGFGPEDITYASAKPVYFKCPEGIHESSMRKVYVITSKSSDQHDFKCKECLAGHAPTYEDLIGKQFGELTVLGIDEEKSKKKNGKTVLYWKCKCSCGNETSVASNSLRNGEQVTCGDKSIHNRGENNPNWKGGITSELLSNRTSKEYKEWRNSVYKKDWYTCQCCGASGSDSELNAHHILSFADNKELRFDVSNGITLCSDCHHIKTIGSFHNLYGTNDTTPEELEEYINNKRKELNIPIEFSLEKYRNGEIMKPNTIEDLEFYNYKDNFFTSVFKQDKQEKPTSNFPKILPRYRAELANRLIEFSKNSLNVI